MGFYVLKFVGLGMQTRQEPFYDEVVSVKNGIALVKQVHNKNQLLGRNFIELGFVESEEDIPALLHRDDVTVEVKKDTTEKFVSLDSIIPDDDKGWYDKLS